MVDETKIIETEQRSKSNTKRIDALEARVTENEKMVTTVNLLANELKHVTKEVSEVKEGVEKILNKPAQRWDSLVDKVLFLVVGAVITYLLTRIGL